MGPTRASKYPLTRRRPAPDSRPALLRSPIMRRPRMLSAAGNRGVAGPLRHWCTSAAERRTIALRHSCPPTSGGHGIQSSRSEPTLLLGRTAEAVLRTEGSALLLSPGQSHEPASRQQSTLPKSSTPAGTYQAVSEGHASPLHRAPPRRLAGTTLSWPAGSRLRQRPKLVLSTRSGAVRKACPM